MNTYGKELILDLHNCDNSIFNRKDIEKFMIELCDLIDMERHDLHFWDDHGIAPEDRQTDPKTKGTSAIQFIMTSNITIHTLDILKTVYLNIFSCKDFDADKVIPFCADFFQGEVVGGGVVDRI